MEEYIRLQKRNDEIWDLLEDPNVSSLDQELLNEELIDNTFVILRFEDELAYEEEVLESLGENEYDREGAIANEDFDLAGET